MGHRIVVPVIRRPEYAVGIEQFDDMSLVHCEVYKWNHAISKRLCVDWEAFVQLHGGPIYALGRDDPRHIKFIRLFGFEPFGEATDITGLPWPLYRKVKPDGVLFRQQLDQTIVFPDAV